MKRNIICVIIVKNIRHNLIERLSVYKMKRSYCIFAAYYLPHLGGIERYVYNLAEKLVQCGDDVTIVTSRIEELPSYECVNGIHIYRIPCFEVMDNRYPIFLYNKETRKIFKQLENGKFDLVIVNARFYLHSLLGAIFAKKNFIPCIILEHGSGHLTVHNKLGDFIENVYEHTITIILRCFCNDFYGTCKMCNDWLKHFHIKSKGIIYNAVNMKEINQSLLQKGEYRKKYNISEEDRVIVFTGRLLKEKGLLSLINAVERLNKEGENLYLFIAGEGALKEEIDRRKSVNIIPLGLLPHQEVFRLLDECDIYCLPSDSEAFCGGVLEAVACKCYIITTSRGGSKELISSKDFGTIIENNDSETVYNAIKNTLNNWQECKKATLKAYNKLLDNFTWDIVVNEIRNMNV